MKSYKINSEEEYKQSLKRQLWHKLVQERYVVTQLEAEVKSLNRRILFLTIMYSVVCVILLGLARRSGIL